jgi:hypothetical protein
MNGKTVLILLLMSLVGGSIAACSGAQAGELMSPGSESPAGAEVTPGREDDVVTSEGDVIESPGEGGETLVPGGPAPPATPGIPVTDWEVYRNDTYGYEIRYPANYVILPEAAGDQEPQPLHLVHFQDRQLAEGETAAMEPPKFSIELFDNSSQLTVEEWLRMHDLLEGVELAPYSLAGVQGVRASSMFMMAPNEWIYLPQGDYLLRLTPLGALAEQMLTTFKFSD